MEALSKDIQSLNVLSADCKNLLPQSVEKSNHIHTQWMAKQIMSLKPDKVSLLGCHFKGQKTSDYRDSTVLRLAQILTKETKVFVIEEELEDCGVHVFSKESIEKLLLSDVFVLGAIGLFDVDIALF